MKNFLKKIIREVYGFINSGLIIKYFLTASLCIVVLVVFAFLGWVKFVDILGVLIGFLIGQVVVGILNVIASKFEDVTKVCEENDAMLEFYDKNKYEKVFDYNGSKCTVIYKETLINKGYKIEVEDNPNSIFKLDDFCLNHQKDLFAAHTQSTIKNFKTIRLDDVEIADDVCKLKLGRSTYYNHLVTNRAADYEIANRLTIRSYYEYGPDVSDFNSSKMSNHIGVNAIVYLAGGEMLLPKRKADSTISKNKVTSSVAIMLPFPVIKNEKGQSVKNFDATITSSYIERACVEENMVRRTKIDEKWITTNGKYDKEKIQIKFLGFGQNIYEVGKPQFYYSVTLPNVTKEDYLKYYEKHRKENLNYLDVDDFMFVVDTSTLKFVGENEVTFKYYTLKDVEMGRRATMNKRIAYEKSFACNVWHELQ